MNEETNLWKTLLSAPQQTTTATTTTSNDATEELTQIRRLIVFNSSPAANQQHLFQNSTTVETTTPQGQTENYIVGCTLNRISGPSLPPVSVIELDPTSDHSLSILSQILPTLSTLSTTVFCICIDCTKPHEIASTFQTQISLIRAYFKLKSFPLPELESLQQSLSTKFFSYNEPGESGKTSSTSNTASGTTLQTDPITLSENLGVKIVVIAQKSEMLLESCKKVNSTNNFDFISEFIQCYLRRQCLKLGAGLIFLSTKKNIEVLNEYLSFLVGNIPSLTICHQLIDKELLFIPSGWDSLAKIQVDTPQNCIENDDLIPFEKIVSKSSEQQNEKENELETVSTALIIAEDETEFLRKLKISLQTSPDLPANSSRIEPLSNVTPVTKLESSSSSSQPSNPSTTASATSFWSFFKKNAPQKENTSTKSS